MLVKSQLCSAVTAEQCVLELLNLTLSLLALQGGVTAEAEGFWVVGREPWRFSMWELVASMEIQYFLMHCGWKVVGVV